ncbi:thioredoxin TrxC [Pseudaquabacterium pictum]|uniref:Thioredoxin n=1 Tax=Pseudaquabacterium pictum TaxID=2315236 RepID=A0A480AWU3_9BURK|nr:thioredoxin TrxC [Rubrivivax pictus]GCL64662.1 thiol reductase thioredoxin [Rubrivivax pictus]
MDTHHTVCAHCGATNRLPAERLGDQPDCGRCHQPLLTGAPIELDDRSFDAFVQKSTLPVLVDFWAPWCGPCRQMAPQFDAAARQLRGQALLVKVNSDDSPETSAKFGIRSIPTLVRLQGGVEQRRQSGALPAAQIVALAR